MSSSLASFISLTNALRMEVLHFREYTSQAKVLGTIVTISGAFVVIFYKGPPIFKNYLSVSSYKQIFSSAQSNWVLGGFYLTIESIAASLWYIYQVVSVFFLKLEENKLCLYCVYK